MEKYDANALNEDSFNNIDNYVDNFRKISSVKSVLMYGDNCTAPDPWLSVIIPTFNRSIIFEEALKSVLEQMPVDFQYETIVVDNTPFNENKSTPALEVIRGLKPRSVLYYHNETNIGSGYNWNRGVELARGKWVCFLHDDDVLCRDALSNIGRLLRHGKSSNSDLGYLNARRVDFNGHFNKNLSSDNRRYPQERLTRLGMLICGHTGAGAPTCGTVVLKKAYIECGGINYDYGPSADAVMCFRIMANNSVVNTDCVIGGYRWDDNSSMQISSLVNCVRADDLIMRYLYDKNSFTKFWGKMFGASVSWRNIYRKINIAKKNKINVSKEDFANSSLFKEPSQVLKILYFIIYAAYRFFRLSLSAIKIPTRND